MLIHLGQVILHSGDESSFKLIADDFIEENLEGLVELIRMLAGPFSSVEGIPRGGDRLAEALHPHCSKKGAHLLVDDVCTTGISLEDARGNAESPYRGNHKNVKGVVVFARGRCPSWVQAIFQMPEALWGK